MDNVVNTNLTQPHVHHSFIGYLLTATVLRVLKQEINFADECPPLFDVVLVKGLPQKQLTAFLAPKDEVFVLEKMLIKRGC